MELLTSVSGTDCGDETSVISAMSVKAVAVDSSSFKWKICRQNVNRELIQAKKND